MNHNSSYHQQVLKLLEVFCLVLKSYQYHLFQVFQKN
jgi:hypothetical protein